MPLLRDVLNRIKWDPAERRYRFSLVIADRMVSKGFRTLHAASITEIHASYFLYSEDGELKHIPLHHVIRVINETTGTVLWEKRSRRPR